MIVKLADLIIDIKNRCEFTTEMCKDYIYSGDRPIDFKVEATREMMIKEISNNPQFNIDYLENLNLYRQICNKVLEYGGLLLHSAAVSVDGEAYLFTALSGTGKTTHMNLWLDKFGERAVVVNGDKPILRKINGVFHVCGTPWSGKENLNNNINVPIKAICVLTRSETNHIEKVEPQSVLHTVLTQTVRPTELEKMDLMLELVDELLKSVSFYKLGCNMEPEAADVSFAGMQ